MIKKLRSRFIVLSMTAVFILLTIIVVFVNVITYRSVVSEADDILQILSTNRGAFPDFDTSNEKIFPRNMSPEIPYESRYFSVLIDADGQIEQTETSMIIAVTEENAEDYAAEVVKSGKTQGSIHNYRFITIDEDDGIRIVFLDWGRRLSDFKIFLLVSSCITFLCYIIFFVVILIFSKKIIRPMAESYEKQKRFITDAGHEIKTPLAVINADIDVLSFELEDNEWIDDARQQVKNLTELTDSLVTLSKMEEGGSIMCFSELILSDMVEETAEQFKTLMAAKNIEFSCKIEPMVQIKGDDKAIRQLISILLDNAVKYTDENGKISINLEVNNKNALFSVYNTTPEEISRDSLPLLFERFYRMDQSRNSRIKGHGIGLSIAKAIMDEHNGRIKAESSDGKSFTITSIFQKI